MRTAQQTLDDTYLEMRWRILSLAADFDRVQRATGGGDTLAHDARVATLRQAMHLALSDDNNRAEQVQLFLSDKT